MSQRKLNRRNIFRMLGTLVAVPFIPVTGSVAKPASEPDKWPGLPQMASTLPGHEKLKYIGNYMVDLRDLCRYTQPMQDNRLENAKDPITGNWCTYVSRGGYWHKAKPGTPAWDVSGAS